MAFSFARWLERYDVTTAGVPWVQTTVTTKPVKPRKFPRSWVKARRRR